MQFPKFASVRLLAMLPAAAFLFAAPAPLQAEDLEVTVMPTRKSVATRPLPPGTTADINVILRNTGKAAIAPIQISVRLESLAFANSDGWQQQGDRLFTTIKTLGPDASAERLLRIRVETAPLDIANAHVRAEVKVADGKTIDAETTLRIADCAGAYRTRLLNLRESLSTPVRDAAEEMRRGDPTLPLTRQFPYAAKRNNELARLERTAAAFTARRGGDAQMATEWFRFMIQRWGSELNAYASQPANPGLCANNYYQIAGYRQGLLPITKHIDATREAAEKALELARKESGESGSADEIVRALLKAAGSDAALDGAALTALAALRASPGNGQRLAPEMIGKLSAAETAAWLADADKRGQKLVQAIEQVLGTIANAHKETCVCAF
jgi:hypothetical protein